MKNKYILSEHEDTLPEDWSQLHKFLDDGKKDLRFLWIYFERQKSSLIFCFCMFLLGTSTTLTIPHLLGKITQYSTDLEHLKKYLILFVCFMLLKSLSNTIFRLSFMKLGFRVVAQIRSEIYQKISSMPLVFFDKNPSGRIMSRSVNDITHLETFFNSNMFTLFNEVVLIIGATLMIFQVSWILGCCICVISIFLLYRLYQVAFLNRLWGLKSRQYISRQNTHAGDLFNNKETFWSKNLKKYFLNRFARFTLLYFEAVKKSFLYWANFTAVHAVLFGLAQALTLVILISRKGDHLGADLVTAIAYNGLIFYPFFELSQKIQTMQVAMAAIPKLQTLLSLEPEVISESSKYQISSVPKIEIKNLSFAYDSKSILKNLNLTLEAGKVSAFVGRTGAGKTTLTQILLRLYPFAEKKVFWNEVDIKEINLTHYRSRIGVINQDFFLFNGTLKENLALYRPEIADETILELMEELGWPSNLRDLQAPMKSFIKLCSHGQKQILMIMRVLIQDPVFIIIDEATSSLDYQTEELIQQIFKTKFKNKTVLMIAHRLKTLSLADAIYKVYDGKIKEVTIDQVHKHDLD
jgi:ABC-type multidrug transport system fused ATPase/permease subunit